MSEELQEELNIIEERNQKSVLGLSLSVREPIEKMLYAEPVLLTKDAKVREAVNLFNKMDIACVIIIDKASKKIIGIFTERDVIRKVISNGEKALNEPIEKYMTVRPEALHLSDPIAFALNKMAAGGYRHIPLVDEKNIPVGCLSVRNIVEHLADCYSKEILNLPPEPGNIQESREGG